MLLISNKMWKFLPLFIVSTILWSYVVAEDCITPRGRNSKCVSMNDCPDLLKIVKGNKALSTEEVTFLRKSHCGFVNRTPKVCCGPFSKPKMMEKLTDPRPTPNKLDDNKIVSEDCTPDDSILPPRGQCGVARDGDRIYGGQVADPADYPWMALIGYKRPNLATKYKCGGFLINRRYVLTAGHCLIGYGVEEHGPVTSVRLGEHDMSAKYCSYSGCEDRRQEIAVGATYPHREYLFTLNCVNGPCRNRHHDIGLIRLAKRATYTYYVQPLCLTDSDDSVSVGENMFIAGWGKTLSGQKSPVKRKLQLSIYDKDKCTRKFKTVGVSLIDNQICAGGKFKEGACKGDSGGPLMRRRSEGWEAVGIISFGYGCGMDGFPGVCTSVAGYIDWINSTLKSSNQKCLNLKNV